MGRILGLKSLNNEKVVVNIELTQNEALKLRGNLDDIHIFSENNLQDQTRLVQRGKRESTKYFLLPRNFRKGVFPSNEVGCLKIETRNQHIFIFRLNKI
jgi:hypothetical protein